MRRTNNVVNFASLHAGLIGMTAVQIFTIVLTSAFIGLCFFHWAAWVAATLFATYFCSEAVKTTYKELRAEYLFQRFTKDYFQNLLALV